MERGFETAVNPAREGAQETNVGAGLLAKASCQPTFLSTVTPLSRASSLPQGSGVVGTFIWSSQPRDPGAWRPNPWLPLLAWRRPGWPA
ncbi:hypothetical protein E4T63_08285 [Pseudomonas fluorescens]|uniref:Uncharacterized protein n=1 Tax=Pseudomonas fluorescens TaxID=294 RepID=A0AAP8YZP5_PSEFL|nr:hypothetical protein E4T63_08285 [Pseudomonas fluorescens]